MPFAVRRLKILSGQVFTLGQYKDSNRYSYVMKRNHKKIIAREFLFLLGTLILFFIINISWWIFYNKNTSQQQQLRTEISNIKQNEEVPYRLEIFNYLQNNLKSEPWNKFDQQSEFLSKSKDSIFASELYENINKAKTIKFAKTKFVLGLINDTISEQYLNRKHSLENELRMVRSSFFSKCITNVHLYRLALILLSISFLLRYLVYAALWSINQLKQEKN